MEVIAWKFDLCTMKHEIDDELKTLIRDYIQFPNNMFVRENSTTKNEKSKPLKKRSLSYL